MPRNIPIGNGSLLVNFDNSYQLRDIYWPHVGQHNHTIGGISRFGIRAGDKFFWLDDRRWRRELEYEEDTLLTRVKLHHPDLELSLECQDVVDFHENIYLKNIKVENRSDRPVTVQLFFGLDLSLYGNSVGDSAYYEPTRQCVYHYKGKCWFVINGGVEKAGALSHGPDQWAIGVKGVGDKEGAWRDAEDGNLSGNDVAQGSVDSVIGLRLFLEPGEESSAVYWFAVGECHDEVAQLDQLVLEKTPQKLLQRTANYWRLWVNKEAHQFGCLGDQLCRSYRRSLLVLRTQIDNRGAILAANDFDIAQFNRDTYSYMWPRDGALVVAGLIDSGYSEISREFFNFCHRVITDEGYMLHKYNPDGSVASSWHGWTVDGQQQLPVQQDETALVIWALWRHFDRYRDIEFIKNHYRGLVIRGANWLLEYQYEDVPLPLPSWDLWEERHGVHGWTVGAVWGGLSAAANFAAAFGEQDLADEYRKAAAGIRGAVEQHLWHEDENRFVRMIERNGDGEWAMDMTLDASLVGLWMFGMFDPDHPKIRATMEALSDRLLVRTDVGGIARYENDYYHQISNDLERVPGNPWLICTLWLAQWRIAIAQSPAELASSFATIKWCAGRALESGVLAEQVHPFTGAPVSVSPLTWSHATLVMTINDYMNKLDQLSE